MNTMYFAVLFFIASATAFEMPDPLGHGRKKCQEQFGFTDEHLRRGPYHMTEFGEYLLCFATEIQHLTNATSGLPERNRVAAGLYHAAPKVIAEATVDCCLERGQRSNAKTAAERIVVFGQCLKDLLDPESYNRMGVWEKPVFHYLDTCKKE